MNLSLIRMALRGFASLGPRDRAITAQQLGQQITTSGLRDEIAAYAPPDIVNAMDRLVQELKEWRG